MRVMVTGGTGNIGRGLIRDLLARRFEVVVLVRTRAGARSLPHGAEALVASFEDVALLREGLRGCDALFLNCAIATGELFQGIVAADLAKHAGVKHIVYLSGQGPEELFLPPHCIVKSATERAITAMGMDYTFLRPNTFMQNDLNIRDAIVFGGVYSLPYGDGGVWRIDARDISSIAATAIADRGAHAGQIHTLVGPERQTGLSIAAAWSRALGKPIRYGGDDLDEFEATLDTMMSPLVAHDIRMIYEHYQAFGLGAETADVEATERLLGRPLRRFDDFAAEHAARWAKLPSTEKLRAGAKLLAMNLRRRFARG